MKIIVLGSSSATPTKKRNCTSLLINFEGENFLFDASEMVQQQLIKAKTSALKINKIFLTHFHADHFLGLPGLLYTMKLNERKNPLNIYGPTGLKKLIQDLFNFVNFKPSFEINLNEISEGIFLKEKKYSVEAVKLNHSVESIGYVFKEKDKEGEFNRKKAIALGVPVGPKFSELVAGKTITANGKKIKPEQVIDFNKGRKGKKVSIIWDTQPNACYEKAIQESDLLFHEATFLEKNKERAEETKHSTALGAAKTAKKTKCKKLCLIHFSARLKEDKELLEEAKQEFKETFAAKDLMEINLK
ncbi:MAG TPA: ribonuclease Z [archaeon]|nr:ribonuclease Z [archaeon]